MSNDLIWSHNMLTALRHIADDAYQRRAWFGKGPEVSSPEEIYSEIYDDCRLLEFIKNPPADVSEQTLSKLQELELQLDEIGGENASAAELVESPSWEEARQTALAAAESLAREIRAN